MNRSEAWTILRDFASSPAGFIAEARAAGLDPDEALSTLVRAVARRPPAPCVPNVWPCARRCGRIAMLNRHDFESPRRDELGAAALCHACQGAMA